MSLGLCPANIPMTWDIRCNHSDVPADHVHVDEVSRQTGRQASKQAGQQASRQAGRQAGKQAEKQQVKARQARKISRDMFPKPVYPSLESFYTIPKEEIGLGRPVWRSGHVLLPSLQCSLSLQVAESLHCTFLVE